MVSPRTKNQMTNYTVLLYAGHNNSFDKWDSSGDSSCWMILWDNALYGVHCTPYNSRESWVLISKQPVADYPRYQGTNIQTPGSRLPRFLVYYTIQSRYNRCTPSIKEESPLCTGYTNVCTLYNVHCTSHSLYTVHCTVYKLCDVQCTFYKVHTVQCTVYIVHFHNIHCTVYNIIVLYWLCRKYNFVCDSM